ncbi:MAG: RdgB/HAM1 family non-canonical purine NTP pyrophosphatase, partial [Candidatus Bilamarchaeaceae archaeon]
MKILFITGNKSKFSEAKKILKQFGVNIVQSDSTAEEIRSDSLEEIASASAKAAHAEFGKPLFVEDSGLFIPSLNGFPGAYSAWVFRKVGNKGILSLARGKKAEFRSCIAYADGTKVKTFTGSVKGKIAEKARGSSGFGYDPIFIPEKTAGIRHSGEKTFAEDPEMKGALSHR